MIEDTIRDNIPCKDCLIIPACKHKYFIDMKNDCSLIERYLFRVTVEDNHVFIIRRHDFDQRINMIHQEINPTTWSTREISNRTVAEIPR